MKYLDRYLGEIIDYGGEFCTRAEAILHMQSIGMDQPNIDRWLQGYELGQRIRARSQRVTDQVLLEPSSSTRTR